VALLRRDDGVHGEHGSCGKTPILPPENCGNRHKLALIR
jgi:hypothetical protein